MSQRPRPLCRVAHPPPHPLTPFPTITPSTPLVQSSARPAWGWCATQSCSPSIHILTPTSIFPTLPRSSEWPADGGAFWVRVFVLPRVPDGRRQRV